jgi:hypothetical protein
MGAPPPKASLTQQEVEVAEALQASDSCRRECAVLVRVENLARMARDTVPYGIHEQHATISLAVTNPLRRSSQSLVIAFAIVLAVVWLAYKRPMLLPLLRRRLGDANCASHPPPTA